MFIFVFWNADQWIKFSTTEDGETTTVQAVNMTDEEIDAMVALKAHEGAMIEGWESEWLDE